MKNSRPEGFSKNPVLSIFSFLMFISVISCTKDTEKVEPASGQGDLEPLLAYLAQTGFDREDIKLENGMFVIDNDILIAREDVEQRVKNPREVPDARTEHWRGYYLVSDAYVNNIRVFIDSSVPSSWANATAGAIDQWNAVDNTELSFSRVSSSSAADITVTTDYSNQNWVARAYLPSYWGRPGFQITINTRFNYLSGGYKLFTIVHEMGHTFGLYHTDQTQGVFIEGTPQNDPNSVMNSYVLPWNGFTAGDRSAVQILYPD